MKTLKKTLCLILAVVMVVGVLILPANAASIKDYKDNEDIKYKEAVEVLSGLGILGGKDTGYFAPKGTLNRAEAAKIIAWMLLGEDAEKLHSNTQIFADVAADNWAAGYIAFCKNEGILAGDGTGNFRPNGELNGVDFGKMLLTALGYDAKLEGYVLNKDWDKNIIAQMLNKNSYIDIGTVLSNPMTREEAAQMAFLALQQSTVKYPTTIHGTSQAVPDSTTLGGQVFGLDKITGVVTANEYADLNSDFPMAAGKTMLDDEITVNIASDWADIGEARYVWAVPGARGTYDAVSALTDTGTNNVWETSAAADSIVRTTKNAAGEAVGMTIDGRTATFLNYNDDANDGYEADIRIEYSLTIASPIKADVDLIGEYDNIEVGTEYTKDRTIRPDEELTALDEILLKYIFDNADLEDDVIVGEVYVGTQSKKDISDEISYKAFVKDYLNPISTDAVLVNRNENGNYVKVIDNNKNGVADYVLKTTYSMDKIVDIDSKGNVTFATLEPARNETVVLVDDVDEGDVVIITALIDGAYYVEKAEVVTGVVTTYSYKNDTITVDGEVYGQSDIRINGADLDLYEDIVDADERTEYDFYLDKYGYVRGFEEADNSTSFALLTEAYTTNRFNNQIVRNTIGVAEVTIGEADTEEYQVSNYSARNGHDLFTDPVPADGNSELVRAEYWGVNPSTSTYAVGATNYDNATLTNVALYKNLDEDNGTIALYDATDESRVNVRDREMIRLANVDIRAGARSYSADDAAILGNRYVSANSSTEYYIVGLDTARDASGNLYTYVSDVLDYFVGYSKMPALNAEDISAAYALVDVTAENAAGNEYGVARVIVFEVTGVEKSADDTVFGYYLPQRTTAKVQEIEAILGNGEEGVVNEDNTWYNSEFNANHSWERSQTEQHIGFYDVWYGANDRADIEWVGKPTANSTYAGHRIYAGVIDRVNSLDYVKIGTTTGDPALDLTDVPIYTLAKNGTSVDTISTLRTAHEGYSLIWVENARGAVIYGILVGDQTPDEYVHATPTDLDGDGINDELEELFDRIQAEKTSLSTPGTYTVTFNAVDSTGKAIEGATNPIFEVTVDPGESYTVKKTDLTPNENLPVGYDTITALEVAKGTCGDPQKIDSTDNYIIPDIESDVVINVKFADATAHWIKLSADFSSTGSVTAKSTSLSDAQIDNSSESNTAKPGETVTLTVKANTKTAGSVFSVTGVDGIVGPTDVKDNASGEQATFTFVMPNTNVTLTVSYAAAKYNVTVNGAAAKTTAQATHGQDYTLQSTDFDTPVGQKVKEVTATVNGKAVSVENSSGWKVTGASVTGPIEFTVTFEPDYYTLKVSIKEAVKTDITLVDQATEPDSNDLKWEPKTGSGTDGKYAYGDTLTFQMRAASVDKVPNPTADGCKVTSKWNESEKVMTFTVTEFTKNATITFGE